MYRLLPKPKSYDFGERSTRCVSIGNEFIDSFPGDELDADGDESPHADVAKKANVKNIA